MSNEEPPVDNWDILNDKELLARIKSLLFDKRQNLILVDGRSGSGKTTFAHKIVNLLNAEHVHTDDIAWHLDPINWVSELLEGVVKPWRHGEKVAYRPPGWVEKGRKGKIEASTLPILIVEGVGAGRAELAKQADLVVWVQSDPDSACSRGIQRDIEEEGRSPDEAKLIWDEWMSSENPFLEAERPWTRAHLIVNGTPSDEPRGTTSVATGPL